MGTRNSNGLLDVEQRHRDIAGDRFGRESSQKTLHVSVDAVTQLVDGHQERLRRDFVWPFRRSRSDDYKRSANRSYSSQLHLTFIA